MAKVDRKQSGASVKRSLGKSFAGRPGKRVKVITHAFRVVDREFVVTPDTPDIRVVIEAIEGARLRSRETGKAERFMIDVRPSEGERKPRYTPELEAALDRARERGKSRVAEILAGRDMLTGEELAERLDVSRMTINTRRQRRQIIGLDGPKRGYRYPLWQFDENGRAFPEIPRLFELLGDNPWSVYRFLTQHHPELEGMTGREALEAGRSQDVLETAEGISYGTFV